MVFTLQSCFFGLFNYWFYHWYIVLYPALNEALTAKVQRLKQIAGEASDPHVPNGSHHHMNRQILEQQLLQLQQKQPSEAQQAQQQQQQESEQFKAQQKQWNH